MTDLIGKTDSYKELAEVGVTDDTQSTKAGIPTVWHV